MCSSGGHCERDIQYFGGDKCQPAELIMMHAGEHLADQWRMLAPSSGGRAPLILFSDIHHSTLAWIVGAYAKCGIETAMIYVGGMPVDSSHHSSHAHRHFGLLLPQISFLMTRANMGSNLKNAVLAILAPLPSMIFYLSFLKNSEVIANAAAGGDDGSFAASLWAWCYYHPVLLANVLFFFNVNVLFWVIGHIQNRHWMISLYWTVIPILLVHYYATHPLAQYNLWRSKIVILLTWVWAIRLNHNYLRRERWQWGAREDWRFTQMRAQYGKNWLWISFFGIYAAQQVFLIGVTLPLYVVHSVDRPLNIWDYIAIPVAVTGITMAYLADTQLHDFIARNQKLKELGKPVVLNLDEGLWYYSRHPNYFGEQLWWWGLVIFAWNLGQAWTFVGSLFNVLCLSYVTMLVEERMLKTPHRTEAYSHYRKTTSVWVPWFKASLGSAKEKPT